MTFRTHLFGSILAGAMVLSCHFGLAEEKGNTMDSEKVLTEKPLVILLGDSIRMGYQGTAKQLLKERADVWSPKENCADTVHTLAAIDTWLKGKAPAVVHINCGLHDMWINEDGSLRHPLDMYLKNVAEIIARIKELAPEAKIIFALTTPVDQERQKTSNYGRIVRNNDDIPRYNVPTKKLAEEMGCLIDDLYSVVMEAGKDELMAADGVHFNPKGCRILGKAVAECVQKALSD